MERRSSKRAREGGHGGYCPYCWQNFPRHRDLAHHWHHLVKRQAKDGRYCSTDARDARDDTKTDLTVFTAWAARARFRVRPDVGGTSATGIAGADANEEGGGDIAWSAGRGGEDDDIMIDGGGDVGGDDADGNSGGIDGEVDAGGSVGESRIGAGSGLAGGDGEGFDQGGPAHHHEDDMSSAGDGAPSLEGVEVEGNDAGYESFESWAGAREDVGAGVDTDDDEDRGSLGDERSDDDDDDGAGRDGKDHAGAGHSMDPAAPHEQANISERSSAGGSSSGCEDGQPPPLDDPRWMSDIAGTVGKRLNATVMEGGPTKTKLRQFGTRTQKWRPFKSLTEILLFVFGVKHQLSGTGMTDLFDILTFVDGQPGDGAGEGRGFDTADVPENGQKFVSRMREFLPLFEVWVRDVVAKPAKKTSGARTTAKVYDIPITQVLDFMLKSRSNMEEIFANPGGAVVAKEEGLDLGLAGEHLFPLPTRPARNARRNNMHGTLVQRMPQHNFDGFLAQARTKVYIGDVVMCELREEGSPEPLQTPCRITATFFVEESRRLVVTVRLFRDAHEVLGVAHDDAAFVQDGVVRVWEEVGDESETDLREITQVLDRVEVFTRAELRDGAHLRPWIGAGSRREGWSFVGEGFVTRRGHRFVKRRDPFKEGGWRRAGSEEENYPDMRSADVIHNDLNLKFINLPIGYSADDFNAFGMATPYSEGAGYWQLLTLDRRLLRRKRWLHATTTAEPGACYDGAMAFAAGVLRELEKGCYTKIVEPSGGVRGESYECTVFARGGMVSKTGDTPERQGSLGFKGVSQRTLHPCSLCKVKQSADADDVGGQLGERDYDVVKNRRTRRECEHGRSKLLEMGFGTGQAVKLSKELGIVEPNPTLLGHPRALWDLTSMHSPMVCVGPELLHLNNLNHLGQSQTFLLDLLSPAGREHVAGIFRQGRTLLGAGVSPLKNPVKDYPGYTGAQKALFGSVQLIVLRGLLLSTATMKHYLNSTALKKYNGEIWGHVSPEEVRDRVLEYFQASSSLSFAANGQEFTDFDLLQLHTRAGDYVENTKLTLGRAGVRTGNHMWLHFADSIKAHGRPQNADVSEGGHQHHKKHNKSGSSRDPPAHHARSTNTKLALMRLATSETYTATRYSYSKKTMITETVTSGPGCQRVPQALDDSLSGGITNVVDGTEGTKPTAAMLAGQPHGSATWRATILRQDAAPNDVRAGSAGGGVAPDDVGGGSAGGGGPREAWEACLSKGAVRPSAGAILNANTLWYACGRSDGDGRDVCKELRCSSCWEGGGKSLKNDEIICHRIKHGVPAKISSGLGRFKGGDVKAATAGGATPRDWAVGSGQGDAVEIFTNPMAKRDDLSGDGHVTLARILYFFDHEGNRRPDSIPDAGPAMEFVLAYEFVTCGSGRSKKADSVTQHPTYWLQGGVKQVPSVYPIEAIRRHVMMYHHCPASSFATGVSHTPAPDSCGLHADHRARGGGKVWKHHYRLAAANPSGPRDAYMLNEHWRSSFQDGVV